MADGPYKLDLEHPKRNVFVTQLHERWVTLTGARAGARCHAITQTYDPYLHA